jgi:guanylate kinase
VKNLLVFIGESGSGKTTLITELSGRYPEQFKKVVTCTSRPARAGEIDAVDYHFLPEEYFICNPNLVLTKRTADGFYYGTRKLDLFHATRNLLLTSRPTGVSKLVSLGCRNIVVVRISIGEKLKIRRMRQRGDTDKIISDRLLSDTRNQTVVDFGKIPVVDLHAEQKIEDKIKLVLQTC